MAARREFSENVENLSWQILYDAYEHGKPDVKTVMTTIDQNRIKPEIWQ